MLAESDIRQLGIFVKFAQTQHMGQAAEQLGMSVASIQRAVRALELEVGVPLIERDGRRVRLLPAGQILAEHGASIMRARSDALEAARAASGTRRMTLRLGHIFSLGYVVVPRFIGRLLHQEPRAKIRLRQGATDTLTAALLSGEIDAAFLVGNTNHPELHEIHIFDESVVIVLPAADPLSRGERVDLAKLSQRRFISLGSGSANRNGLIRSCARAGFRPNIVLEADDLGTLEGAVAAGLGLAVVPRSMSGNPGPHVIRLPINERSQYRYPVALAYPRSAPRNDALSALIGIISHN